MRLPQIRLSVSAPSNLLLSLLQRAARERSERANEIVARGMFGKRMFAQLQAMLAAQKETADAGSGELAAASEQPADRAEAVLGA